MNNLGKGIFGVGITPSGIKEMRKIFADTTKSPEDRLRLILNIAQQRLATPSESRDSKVTQLYTELESRIKKILQETPAALRDRFSSTIIGLREQDANDDKGIELPVMSKGG